MGPHYYYYLVASLPTLSPDTASDLSTDEFLNLCRRYLLTNDLVELANARIDNHDTPAVSSVYAEWREFEQNLREQLVMLRAGKLGWDASDFLQTDPIPPPFVTEEIRTIFELTNPLVAETRLFRLRWEFLNEREGRFFMRQESLVVYYLKLQLIEQRSIMTGERGELALKTIRNDFAARLPAWKAS